MINLAFDIKEKTATIWEMTHLRNKLRVFVPSGKVRHSCRVARYETPGGNTLRGSGWCMCSAAKLSLCLFPTPGQAKVEYVCGVK